MDYCISINRDFLEKIGVESNAYFALYGVLFAGASNEINSRIK